MLPPRRIARQTVGRGEAVILRPPCAEDGPAVSALIAASPPLDRNSAYCNLLQCAHFVDTCVVAEQGGEVIGWVSGYRPPTDPDSLFIWQVAVAGQARGQGLGPRMIAALLDRPTAHTAARLIATVTDDNAASWAMFSRVAEQVGATIERRLLFDCEQHFAGAHATEWQATIAPLRPRNQDIEYSRSKPT